MTIKKYEDHSYTSYIRKHIRQKLKIYSWRSTT